MVDATIVKVHRHGQSAKGGSEPSHRPFQRRHDDQNSGADRRVRQSRPLCSCPATLSIRWASFRSSTVSSLRASSPTRPSTAIPSSPTSTSAAPKSPSHSILGARLASADDTQIYKWRHLIEDFFCKLKEFKRIAMRADKTDQSFRRKYPTRRSRDKLSMNLNRP
ncbi:hypothetical protein ACFLEY_12155 [Bradyrhizobium sp. YCK136]|uniref:hypothetical protein n=1 Tax=Bradyrhizobium TaxID=374 RepID=UPI001B8BB69B|nr:hypothetical protein [Bradyrhizobium diazoefficiens]MBR0868066.1 hypothetical protein [Bradyrhizobium diazoefficiens]MBR0892105.1 hypothetical protein [Bradyrhizobium diazoefficiens]MBR0924292.1 hypothetical protein [Bradyrhizobium diazoefficiens]